MVVRAGGAEGCRYRYEGTNLKGIGRRGRRGAATGVGLENASLPVKEMIMNGDTHATTTSNSFSCSKNNHQTSSSSTSSSDDESDDTNENMRKEENQHSYEQKENETQTATHEEMYNMAQENMGAIQNDTREATKAFAVARDLRKQHL
eukprot:scaffold348920_cov55-Attheya_sp.AAC.1